MGAGAGRRVVVIPVGAVHHATPFTLEFAVKAGQRRRSPAHTGLCGPRPLSTGTISCPWCWRPRGPSSPVLSGRDLDNGRSRLSTNPDRWARAFLGEGWEGVWPPEACCWRYLNQYQGGMCISGVLKTTSRTPRHLISPSRPNWGRPTVRSSDMYISPWL